jgi:putative DNA primase/helicase
LDAVAAGLRLWSEVRLPELERMADFTHWGEAVAQGVGWPPGAFVTAYRANRHAASSVSLEESLVAQPLLELAKYHGPWKGTLTQFLELIAEWTGYHSSTTPGWPKTPSRAAVELRRIAPQLRMFGLSVTFERSSRAARIVTFTPTASSDRARAHVG